MKKLVSLLVIVILFNVQSISAQSLKQDNDRPEVAAKAQVNKLTNDLKLNGEQSRTLYRVFVVHEVNYRKLIDDKNNTKAILNSEKKKLDASLEASIKKTLTKEQYSNWLSIQKQ